MTPAFYFIVFFFGLAVGSFLNSVIYRLYTGDSLFGRNGSLARSYCPNCRHKLGWQDLVPLLSFILLRGRCRYCHQPISLQYPLVELATGLIFAALFHLQINFSDGNLLILGFSALAFWSWHLFYWFFIAGALIVIFAYDLRHFLIPDAVIYPALGIAFLNRLLEFLSSHYWTQFVANSFEFNIWNLELVWDLGFGIWNFDRLITPLFAAVIASAFFLTIVLVSRGRWMGVGDIKLAFLMGLVLGFPNIITALFIAFLFGAIAGIILVLAKKRQMKSEVPFGPFLVTGTFIALFWGQNIIDWYWNFFV